MRVGIIGFGSIAQRHLKNLRALLPAARIIVCHLHSRETAVPDGADEVVFGLGALAACKPDIALVTGPANTHFECCLEMVRCGADLFVEKPLSDSLENLDQLAEECHKRDRILMVGYVLRFHRPIQILKESVNGGEIGRVLYARAEVGQYLPDWRPHLADYRQSVTARKDLGGGVLLELSHELDYLRWILGDFKSIWGFSVQIGDLDIDVEDAAELVLTGPNREMVSVHLDMLQRSGGRTCHIHGTEGSLVWKSSSQSVEIYRARDGKWEEILSPHGYDRNGMYMAELQHFLDCVRTRTTPSVGYEDGRMVLRAIEAVRKLSSQESMIAL
jgi:predicted dehydrogenase